MEKTPIKSSLFRFVTLRGPQLPDDKKKDILFVAYPEEMKGNSKALSAAKQDAVDAQTREENIKTAHDTDFTPVEKRYDFKDSGNTLYSQYKDIYEFSNWLMRNKLSLSYAGINSNLGNAQSVSVEEELVIWENLFYQIIHKKSVTVRESLIQILVTNQFLKAVEVFEPSIVPKLGSAIFTEKEKKEFEQRANASVIIPKDLLVLSKQTTSKKVSRLSIKDEEFLRKTTIVDRAKVTLEEYKTSLKELERAEIVYNKEEAKKIVIAEKNYETRIAEIKSQPPVMKEITDPVTGEQRQVETYPELETLKLEYERSPELREDTNDEAKSSEGNKVFAQLSAKTQALIVSSEFEIYDSFSEMKAVLQGKIKQEQQLIVDNAPQASQRIIIGGETVNLSVNEEGVKKTFGGRIVSSNILDLWFTIDNPSDVVVSEAVFSIKNSVTGEVAFSGTTFRKTQSSDTRFYIDLFNEAGTLVEGGYSLEGELTFGNGKVISFKNEGNIAVFSGGSQTESREFKGFYEYKQGDNSEISTDDEREIFGVTQLGIADFRRVEQEICCYVPGEVSHIENIMAREYKERSTRNLMSTEVSTERSTERETENLTDTTSTERNELQTEASTIVNQDNATSFGANASVSGEFLGGTRFAAGTNFNTTSSSATSDSNLQAQNYAQEVTERALDRVVEKVSSKRTSRILKEFEENNTHGFDNRKGDQHVTGVYRWVDIKYKNTLVNYGKRLMYEFAIPEPAKFYIDCYLAEKKENTIENSRLLTPKKPVHPKSLELPGLTAGLTVSAQLNEDNYQRVASEYNAEVRYKPSSVKSLGKSFSFTVPETNEHEWDEIYSENAEIDIPEGYETAKVKAIYKVNDETGYDLFTLAGGQQINGNLWYNISGFREELPVSYSVFGFHTGSVHFEVECRLTDEGEEQWENETYKVIMDAYNTRLQEYNDFIQGQNIEVAEEEKQREFSSQLNRGIEKREIKRIAIDLMTAPFKDIIVSQSHYIDAITINKGEGLDNHAAVAKFFEQAFDWEIMAYTFYPYYYKQTSDWIDNFEYLDTKDPIFKSFLQSSMARAVLPVRSGFEDAVNWFMSTGEIWNGQGMITDVNDDLYLSVAEELLDPKGEVEGTWETRVPTALTILQAESVVLEEGGLPCREECGEGNSFQSSTNTLGDGATEDASGSEGVDFDIVGENNDVR